MNNLTEIRIVSFGFKYGVAPSGANIVFDVRFIHNPHYIPELRPLNGEHELVAAYISAQESARNFLLMLRTLLRESLHGFRLHGHDHNTLIIAFGCTGGKHRSVYFARAVRAMVEELVRELALPSRVSLEHIDLGRE